MKVKILLLILIFLVAIAPIIFAEVECSKVFVVNFNYDGGIISYKEKVIKCGYAPDNVLQPKEGYTLEVLSEDNKLIYSFKFEIPLKFNFDFSDPIIKSLSGGMLVLNETDFALIFPYYDKAKSIVIYNPRMYKVLEVPLIEEKFIQKRSFWWVFLLILILLIGGYIVYRYYRSKKRLPAKNL